MCLGIPGKVLSTEEGDLRMGRVAFGGIVKEVCLEYTPEAREGDYVVVHVGFAISVLDEAAALETYEYLDQIGDLGELGIEGAGKGDRERPP